VLLRENAGLSSAVWQVQRTELHARQLRIL